MADLLTQFSAALGKKPAPTASPFPVLQQPNPNQIMGQANTQASSIYQPILDQINSQYERERQEAIARQQAFAAATDQAYAGAAPKIANIYNSGIQQLTELENAVSNRLKGVGESRSSDFAARLAQIGAPTESLGELQTTYKGADASKFARGMNDVARLTSRGAEARAYNEKQPGLARQQSQSELNSQLMDLFNQYSDERGGIVSHIPEEVQNIYDKLFGQAQEKNKTKYDEQWQNIQFIQSQIKEQNELKLAAQALGDKKAARAATAREKALSRDLERWKAQLSADTKLATDNPPKPAAKASEPNKKFNPDGSPNPNYNPKAIGGGKKGNGNDTVETAGSAKRNRAVQSAWNSVTSGAGWNPAILDKLRRYPNSADAVVNTAINASLRAQGVKVPSAVATEIRNSIRARLSGRVVRRADKDGKPGEVIGRFTD